MSTGRQIFSGQEKMCLQKLIVKYKLNSASTITAGNPAAKKVAWARLLEEFNSIETNSKRTESQLKKCWDNIKTRKKAQLVKEKKDRMRTRGEPFHPHSGTSTEVPMLIDDALVQNGVDPDQGGAKNIRARVITNGLEIRRTNYERSQEREEELHQLMIAEKQLCVKIAEELLKKVQVERQTAEVRKEEAELDLYLKKRNT